jgi:hypothetical protein
MNSSPNNTFFLIAKNFMPRGDGKSSMLANEGTRRKYSAALQWKSEMAQISCAPPAHGVVGLRNADKS